MHIGPLPAMLGVIVEDDRTNLQIIAALEARGVSVFAKDLIVNDSSLLPLPGTPYCFLATVSSELPQNARLNPYSAYDAAVGENRNLGRASPRSALLLMERMVEVRFFADIFVMHQPIRDPRDGRSVFLGMGYESEERVPWIAAVADDHAFESGNEIILFHCAS